MTMLHVDLCTGLGGWRAPFEESDAWTSVGIDVRDDLNADVVGDVRSLPFDCSPTLLTASPPCTEFTKWYLPWHGGGAKQGKEPSMGLVGACLSAVDELSPEWWILENVQGLHVYWKPARKRVGPYHLWGEFPPFDCSDPQENKQDLWPSDDRAEKRAKIPYHLADALRRSVEIFNRPQEAYAGP